MKAAPVTLVDLLVQRAEVRRGALAYRFLNLESGPDDVEEWSYAELDRRARAIAAKLQESAKVGDRAVLLYPPGLDFIAALIGCFYAGVIAVPSYPPHPARPERTLGRLRHIAQDCDAAVVLTTPRLIELREALCTGAPEFAQMRWLTSEADPGAAQLWKPPAISGETIAFLQYTSGSTGRPKGVTNLHSNVLKNEEAIAHGFRSNSTMHVVGWLPLFHDMGLIGNVLHPLYMAASCTLMSPAAFLKRPLNWLAAISQYGGTVSGGPNFAYDLCAVRIPPEDREALDLSSWLVAYNGSEPVRKETMDRFAAVFEPCGFRKESFLPCYGLAEATLYVTGSNPGGYRFREVDEASFARNVARDADDGSRSRLVVSSGRLSPAHGVMIADPKTLAPVPQGAIGEVWAYGPSIAAGYWNNSRQSEHTFPLRMIDGEFTRILRTGDLGFVLDGELFITGRIKDMIILRGRNLYPHDIEATIGSAHPKIRPIGVAAFSIEEDGRELLVILVETSLRREGKDSKELCEAIRSAVATEHEASVHAIALVAPNRIPRTSSGKIRRHACREGWLNGTLSVIAASVLRQSEADEALDSAMPEALELEALNHAGRLAALRELIRRQTAAVRGTSEPLEPDASLVDLGLDSLMTLELQARLERALGISLITAALADVPNLDAFAAFLLKTWERHEASHSAAIVGGPRVSEAPAASGQQRLYLLEQLADGAPVYHVQFGTRMRGPLDADKLLGALRELERRHPILRTRFVERDGITHQVVEPDRRNEFGVMDATDVAPEHRDAKLAALAMEQGERPFHLDSEPLLRALLVSFAPDDHALLITQHHIVTDGWSIRRMIGDLADIYGALVESRALPAAPRLAFADFARWEQERAIGEVEARAFWMRRIAALPRLDLPLDALPPHRSYRGGRIRFDISSAEREGLSRISREENCTLFAALLTVYALLLHRYSGQEDLAIGSVAANRRPELRDVYGFFANTVLLRCDLGGSPTFREGLRRMARVVRETLQFASFPFSEITRLSGGPRDPDENPLFQASFFFETSARRVVETAGSTWSALFWTPDGSMETTAKFDLSLSMMETANGISGAFEYAGDRLRADTVRRMASGFQALLREAVTDPERTADRFDALSSEDRDCLDSWNDTSVEIPVGLCFHELFERQVQDTPDAPAATDGERSLTHDELNRGANRIARRLRRLGVGPESLVALMMPRGVALLSVMLAVFKTGAAYVPIDPDYPEQRRVQILRQSSAAWLVTSRSLASESEAPASAEVLFIEDLEASGESEENVHASASPDNLAYVIYTSGSTGIPKGAMVHHAGMLNHLYAKIRELGMTRADVVAQTASQCFDISVWQFLSALLVGGRTHVFDRETAMEARALFRETSRAGVTILEVVPSLLRAGLEELPRGEAFETGALRWLMLTGEALPPELARGWLERHAVAIVNAYGPTECSDDVTHHIVRDPSALDGQRTPIGRAIINTQLHVLDRAGRPTPVGVAGELHVGGICVGRGYWCEPARTAEAFVPDPFSSVPGARLYRTGDRVRQLADGNLVFLGRDDDQVKVRGFRIELGEVQIALEAHADVAAACVVAYEKAAGDNRVLAYVTLRNPVSSASLRTHLRGVLPDYMVPSGVVELASLPLTPNGKVDRRGLPMPGPEVWEGDGVYVAPRTPVEEVLASIWCEVLGLERVGIEDDFFALGGHSLLATQVMSRVRGVLGVELGLRNMFEAPTVMGLAAEIERPQAGAAPLAPPLVRQEHGAEVALSFAQQRLWFLEQLAPGGATYNVAGAVRIEGPLEMTALRRAFDEVVRRHESLRTRFVVGRGQAHQRIMPPMALDIALIDLAEEDLDGWLRLEASRSFDLELGGLLRASVVRLGAERHVLSVCMHHIISDGWSLGVLMGEVSALYRAYLQGEPSPLKELAVQYADYSVWQRDWLKGEVLDRQVAYWRDQLEDMPTALDLPLDRPRPADQSQDGAQHPVRLEPELATRLKVFARERGATLYMALLCGFMALLSRYSAQDQLLVGSPIAGRTRRECEGLIGFFVNTLVLRADLSHQPGFERFLEQVKHTTLGAFAHQDVPFEKLVEVRQFPKRDLSRSPFFQAMFILQNAPQGRLELANTKLEPIAVDTSTAKFEITLALEEQADGAIEGYWEYRRDLFCAQTIQRMATHYQRLLIAALDDPNTALSRLEILTAQERHTLLDTYNDTSSPYPDTTLHSLFEAQVEQTPDATALIFNDTQITYRQLNNHANTIAHAIISYARQPIIGICMQRSPQMIAAILAILKTNAAFVPLDPAYPSERLRYMAQTARLATILTDARSQASFETDAHWIDVGEFAAAPEACANPDLLCSPDYAAYVVFTSGSTGLPTGVVGLHRGAINRCHWMWRLLPFAPGERSAMKTSTSFVDFIWEIFGPLLGGVPSVIVDGEQSRDLQKLINVLEATEATRIIVVPSLMRAMLATEPRLGERLPRLLHWTSSGEALDEDLVRAFRRHTPGRNLLNLYGCSEASGDSTAQFEVDGAGTIPIGRPIDNTQTYILDANLQPVPAGLKGELYIGGDGLAQGYLFQPALTAERFLPDPFSRVPGARLYRTLDVVRYRSNGAIEYVGRADRQVKVRGMRVDLREIELAIATHPALRQAVVLQVADRLAAYVVAEPGAQAPSKASLRTHLRGVLPDYMVPSGVVELASLPLTPNGKVDRRGLPMPGPEVWEGDGVYVAPRTPVEEVLASIWCEVLGLERVGIEDDFFALGGHSLLATQVMSRVRGVLGVELGLRNMFEAPTVMGLAAEIERPQAGAAPLAPPLVRQEHGAEVALSFAQQRLWFLEQLAPGGATYNVAGAVRIEGPLEMTALRRAFDEVVRRHESLRTRFVVGRGQAHQRIMPPMALDIALIDLAEEDLDGWLRLEASRSFDLELGGLLRASVVRLGAERHVLSVCMHHIISDGWSLGVLMGEVSALYRAYLQGEPSPLKELAVQYADYSVWQRDWLKGEVLDRQVAYWRDQLEDMPTALDLPLDRPRPADQSQDGAQHPVRLEPELATRLKVFARERGATLYMALLCGFMALLSRYSAQDQLLVGSPIAGRTRRECEGLIGFFVNTLVLRADLSHQPGFERFLEQVKHTTLGAFAHQDVPFEKLVEVLSPKRDLSRSPFFQAMFILQNAPQGRLELANTKLEPIAVDTSTAKFEITLALEEQADGAIEGYWEYRRDLFCAQTIQRMATHYQRLLIAALDDPNTALSRLEILTAQERHTLLDTYNDTSSPYPDTTLHSLFEAQVEQTPDATALIFNDTQITYRQLNNHANTIAHAIISYARQPIIGICMQRSPQMIAAILAILKTNAAFVPLDPAYPRARIAFMLEDTGATLVLSLAQCADRLPENIRVMQIDMPPPTRVAAVSDPDTGAGPDDLFYILYTSGSTGRPKGVVVPHRGIVNCLSWMQRHYHLDASDRFLFKTSLNFDPSIWEIFWPLITGGTVVIAPQDTQADPAALRDLANAHDVTSLYFVPSMLQAFLETPGVENIPSLRRVICGGEKLSQETLNRFFERLDVELHHSYGPTETSIAATEWTCAPDQPRIVIGRPLGNVQLYVLDRAGQLVPLGVAGELHIGGPGVAIGYAGRPELTAERFVPDPSAALPGGRLYRTGDLVRYLPNGNLEFLGRIDEQVKVRGYRIELGEVESVLERGDGVLRAVATCHTYPNGEKYLVAHVVLEDPDSLDAVRETARRHLPEYMVPSVMMAIESIPLTVNGKIDRKALPAPQALARPAYTPPTTDTEKRLAAIWAELFALEHVGIEYDFFELGGHSLLATRMLAHVNEAFALDMPLRQVFELRTIAELARAVDQAGAMPVAPAIARAERRKVRRSGISAAAAEPQRDSHDAG